MMIVLRKPRSNQLFITMLDVGQGDGICIQNEKNGCYFIDGGSTSQKAVGEFCLESYLKYEGISKIDGWFISHTDLDHISGLIEILESYQCTWDGRNRNGITIEKIFFTISKRKNNII